VTGLVAPQLLPGLALWLAMLLPLFTLTRDWCSTDWWGLSWALAARIPGTAIGVWLVSVLLFHPRQTQQRPVDRQPRSQAVDTAAATRLTC
jgi:hypothetical protein